MLLTDDVSHVPVSLRSFVGGGEGLPFWDSPPSSSVVLEDKYFLFCLCRSIGDGMLGWEWMNGWMNGWISWSYTQTHCLVFLCYQAPDLHLLEVFHWLCKIWSHKKFLWMKTSVYMVEPTKPAKQDQNETTILSQQSLHLVPFCIPQNSLHAH